MENNLENLDLNLLLLLKMVVETRNTSTAAEKLGISQTSVSRGMAKLRETFGDQLFIRKAHGVEPSELAEKLAEAAENMLTPIVDVMDAYSEFDAEKFEGNVVVAFEVSLLEIFGRGIYDALSKALPKASLKLVYWQEGSLQGVLEREIDYLIHFTLYPLPQDIYTHALSNIKISLIARKGHPVLSTSSQWEDIHDLPIVKLVSNAISAKHDPFDEAFIARGYRMKTKLVTHSIPIAVDRLVNSDSIKFSSSYLLTHSDELASYDLPPGLPSRIQEVSVMGGYLQAKRGFPLSQFLHQTIQSFFNGIFQPDLGDSN